MNTRYKKLMVVPILLASVFGVGNVQADSIDKTDTLFYNNRAYVHAIHNEPNPAKDIKVGFAKIAYADKAYGQAIYSYPGNIAFQETDFNVEYVDTAYGQAIYSYPNNNPVQPHLELSAELTNSSNYSIVPVVLTRSKISDTIVNP